MIEMAMIETRERGKRGIELFDLWMCLRLCTVGKFVCVCAGGNFYILRSIECAHTHTDTRSDRFRRIMIN